MWFDRCRWWVVLAGLVIVAPACSLPGFACEGPNECISDGVQGICQPSGFCSFPDMACDTAQRYGNHAGEFSSECVGMGDASDSAATADGTGSPNISEWTYARVVSVTTTSPTPLSNHQIALDLAAEFDHTRAGVDGADVRFVTSLDPDADTLSHYTERWNDSGASRLWVRMPELTAEQPVDVYMMYGNPDAAPGSSFDDTFPNAFVSEGAQVLGGTQTFGWFHIRPDDTVEIEPGEGLTIDARNLLVEGALVGTGAGHAGGDDNPNDGAGPGGGASSTEAGGGGGGHGGAGGGGGYDADETRAQGGSAYGEDDSMAIDMGSGGGGTDIRPGGAGGGAVTLRGRSIAVSGEIRVDGEAGLGTGQTTERGGGGGSGGGIVLAAVEVTLGGLVSARGGDGGNRETDEMNNDGGGGGGGGRIKVFHGPIPVDSTSLRVEGGVGGLYGDASVGDDGSPGVTHTEAGTTDISVATLGPEMML